jgi:Mce-associated membrane protein
VSPRRRFRPGEQHLLVAQQVQPRRRGLPLAAAVGALVMVAAVTACALMFVSYRSTQDEKSRGQQAISYVTGFMQQMTSIDPFHANDYIARISAQATGDFAKHFQDQSNQILLQVAQAEPATGTVLDAGLERWNDDGSASVIVATEVTSKSSDEKQVIDRVNRWMVAARQEGNQWKISNLLEVT